MACVRSGISGWVIGLLSRVRAPNGARPILVAGAGRRRGPPPFSILDLEIGGGEALTLPISIWLASSLAELFGDRRSQQLAGGRPSDVAGAPDFGGR